VQDFLAKSDGNLFDQNQGNHPFAPGGTQIDYGRFSPDAGTLMVVINSGNIYRFSVTGGKEINRFDRGGGGMATRFDSSADGQYLLATTWRRSQVVRLPDGRVKGIPATAFPVQLWSIGNERIIGNCELPGAGADCVSLSPDTRLAAIATLGDDPHIELRTIPDLQSAGRLNLPSRAGAVQFSASGKLLAASIADGGVLVWDLDHIPPSGEKQ
jgi:WD40 repeat protein